MCELHIGQPSIIEVIIMCHTQGFQLMIAPQSQTRWVSTGVDTPSSQIYAGQFENQQTHQEGEYFRREPLQAHISLHNGNVFKRIEKRRIL